MILLVRHGRTIFNEEGRPQGGLDSPLTALGRSQAVRVGHRLAQLIEDPLSWAMVASPLGRTVHTAELIGAAMGFGGNFELDPRLAELRMGDWEGLTGAEIDRGWPGQRGEAKTYDFLFRAPGGETYDALAARLGDWLDQALADPRPTLAISHGMSIRVLRGLYLNLEPAAAIALDTPQDVVFRLDQGQVTRIEA